MMTGAENECVCRTDEREREKTPSMDRKAKKKIIKRFARKTIDDYTGARQTQ